MINKKKKNLITAIVLVLFMIFLFVLTFYNIGIYNREI
jgi:preprotein translocase subunit SecE